MREINGIPHYSIKEVLRLKLVKNHAWGRPYTSRNSIKKLLEPLGIGPVFVKDTNLWEYQIPQSVIDKLNTPQTSDVEPS